MEKALFGGATFAFSRLVYGAENNNSLDYSEEPLMTERIVQPDDGNCEWVGFSPVNDQVAFITGIAGKTKLYVSSIEKNDSFELLWESSTGSPAIHACAWSSDGKEIAFIVRTINSQATPKSARISIYVVDVASKTIHEPVIIGESIAGEDKRLVNVSYTKGLVWWGESCVCMPTDSAQYGGVVKFDARTGRSEMLIPGEDDTVITNLATTRSGELRFVKVKGIDEVKIGQNFIFGLSRDGIVQNYADLTQQFGSIFGAVLSQDGEYAFVLIVKCNTSPRASTDKIIQTYLIYRILDHSVIGSIPRCVDKKGDIFGYRPVTVRNDRELIMIETSILAVDGGKSMRNPIMKAVKLNLL